ncbi:hypothetical protein TNCV_4193591 [Trichonephila clavipes]|nr:hypothetical protein TNCV_4193591 [Trichonephila clavipes]
MVGGADLFREYSIELQISQPVWWKVFSFPTTVALSKGCLHSHACRDPYTHKYWGERQRIFRSKTRQRPLRCNLRAVPDQSESHRLRLGPGCEDYRLDRQYPGDASGDLLMFDSPPTTVCEVCILAGGNSFQQFL